jgi:excisionase family DNA binding protein
VEGSPPPSHSPLEALAEALAEHLAARLRFASGASPWMTTAEAIEYTRIPKGTFEKLSADGVIPSHGGRRKLFHRDEVDQALLGYARRRSGHLRASRRGDAAEE